MSDAEEEMAEAEEMAEIEEMEALFDRSVGLDDDLGQFEPFLDSFLLQTWIFHSPCRPKYVYMLQSCLM